MSTVSSSSLCSSSAEPSPASSPASSAYDHLSLSASTASLSFTHPSFSLPASLASASAPSSSAQSASATLLRATSIESTDAEEEGEVMDISHKKKRARFPVLRPPPSSMVITHFNVQPIYHLPVEVEFQYTKPVPATAAMPVESRTAPVQFNLRLMGSFSSPSTLYLVAKDVFLFAHLRRSGVSKTLALFPPEDQARMPVLVARGSSDCAQTLAVLTLSGVRRLSEYVRTKVQQAKLQWVLEEVRKLLEDPQSVQILQLAVAVDRKMRRERDKLGGDNGNEDEELEGDVPEGDLAGKDFKRSRRALPQAHVEDLQLLDDPIPTATGPGAVRLASSWEAVPLPLFQRDKAAEQTMFATLPLAMTMSAPSQHYFPAPPLPLPAIVPTATTAMPSSSSSSSATLVAAPPSLYSYMNVMLQQKHRVTQPGAQSPFENPVEAVQPTHSFSYPHSHSIPFAHSQAPSSAYSAHAPQEPRPHRAAHPHHPYLNLSPLPFAPSPSHRHSLGPTAGSPFHRGGGGASSAALPQVFHEGHHGHGHAASQRYYH